MPSNIVPILKNESLSDQWYRMELPYEKTASAGQFVMVRAEHSAYPLPRAISVCDSTKGKLVLVYQVVGRGTAELSRLTTAHRVVLTGPIGQGFPVAEAVGQVALVGGGVGVAPLVFTARSLQARGISTQAFLGYRAEPLLHTELAGLCEQVHIATENGTVGSKGYVTDIFDPTPYSAVYCCGPTPMMKAVTTQCEAAGVPIYVSLEQKMACGVGACLVCTCTTKDGKNKRTCLEGPVYHGEEIAFDV